MDTIAFLEEMADILDMESHEVCESTLLHKDIWNSLAVVSTIALIDEQCGLTVPGDQLAGCKTIDDILKIIQSQTNS